MSPVQLQQLTQSAIEKLASVNDNFARAVAEVPDDEWEDFLLYIVEGKDVTLHPQAHPEQRLFNLPDEPIEERPEFAGIGAEA